MNTELVKKILGRTEGIHAWLLRRVETDATTVIRLPALYTVDDRGFVRHPNPHPREVINAPGEETWVTVYSRYTRDGNDYMGDAVGQLVSDDESAVRQVLGGLVAAARSQPNKPFAMLDGSLAYPQVELADQKMLKATRPELLAQVQDFSEAILAATEREESVDVSNLELFLRRVHTRLETSIGTGVEFDSTRADAEVCFIARFKDKVAEHTGRPHARRLIDLKPTELAKLYSGYARDIALAGPPPQYEGPVVLMGEAAFHGLCLDASPLPFHCGARPLYEKMSRYEKGKPVSGDTPITGDPLTVVSDPLVPFGSSSTIFSLQDGSPARRATLVKDGLYEELLGSRRYYDYLGLLAQGVQPSGPQGNTVIPAGRHPTAELLTSDKVAVVRAFSDFRADMTSGDFACEIRLGEVREGGKTTPFKGGLLIGNWFTAMADVRLSKETMVMDDYHGPSAVRFGHLQVAG
jgi:predicted Zn-dependent protease